MSQCESNDFKELMVFKTKNSKTSPNLCKDIEQAEILYSNAKFYYQAAELQGALISYSCAAILLDSIKRNLESTNLGKGRVRQQPPQQGQPPQLGRVRSVSLDNSDDEDEEDEDNEEAKEEEPAQPSSPLEECKKILNCALNAVEDLQSKVKTSSSGGNKDDEEEKNWDKICLKNQPLTFEKGSSDCIFFKDVIGLAAEKKLVESSLIYPLVYPNLYPKASKGILIYGPPGTGKTFMVKAAVNQLQVKEPGVGVLFFAPSPGDLKGKYVGETEKRIEEVFTCASKAACKYEIETCAADKKKYISIIFMDEMDAIGPNRDRDTTGLAANSVNTLLQMMDGIKSFPNVAVVAATNYPWNLDDAILRRFDTQILIDLPTEADILSLLNDEMKRIVTLKTDKTGYSYCENKKKEEGKTNNKDSVKKDNCTLACEQKVVEDLYSVAPYNKVSIDFNEEMKKKDGLIAGIASMLFSKGFSNSDVSRLMKSAATNSGELAVKANIFYSTRLLNDFNSDKYVSCLTRWKNEDEAIKKSTEILQKFISNSKDSDIYQAEKPKYISINFNGYTYYNMKSLLYKSNDYILSDPLITDVYIKGHKTPTPGQPNVFSIDDYKANILGYKVKSAPAGGPIEFEKSKSGKYVVDSTDIILAFNFNFNLTSSLGNENILVPASKVLITSVLAPLYNSYKNAQKNFLQYNIFKEGEGNKWFTKTYGPLIDQSGTDNSAAVIGEISNKDYPIFIIGAAPDENVPNRSILNDACKLIVKVDATENTGEKSLIQSVKNLFSDLKFHNLDFYNYLLFTLQVKRIQEDIAIPGAVDAARNARRVNVAGAGVEDDAAIEILANAMHDEIKNSPLHITSPNNFYESYINFLLIEVKDISFEKINFNAESFSNKLKEKKFTSVTLSRASGSITQEESLLYDKENKNYYITLDEFKSFIKNFDIYSDTPFNKEYIANYIRENDKYSDYYVVISQKYFEILFKDVFELKKDFFGQPNLENVISDDLKSQITQLYIDDILNYFDFCKRFYSTTTDGYRNNVLKLYIYILSQKSNIEDIINICCLRIYDNSKFVENPNEGYKFVLGTKVNDENELQTAVTEAAAAAAAAQQQRRAGGGIMQKSNPVSNNHVVIRNDNKTLKKKNKRSKKSVTYKNKKMYGGATTADTKETPAAGETNYTKFIRFCFNTDSKTINNNIVDKEVFVATTYNLAEIKKQRRSGGLLVLWEGLSSVAKSLSDTIVGYFTKKTGVSVEQTQELLKHEAFEEMKKKQQLLPVIFKKITHIGFFIDKTDEIHPTASELLKFFYKKTINDSKIEKNDKNLAWVSLMNAETTEVLRGLVNDMQNSHFGIPAWWGNFSTACFETIGLGAYAGLGATGTITAPLFATSSAAAFGTLILGYSIYQYIYIDNVDSDYILDNIMLSQVYETITKIRFMNTDNLDINPCIIFSNNINAAIQTLNDSWFRTKGSGFSSVKTIDAPTLKSVYLTAEFYKDSVGKKMIKTKKVVKQERGGVFNFFQPVPKEEEVIINSTLKDYTLFPNTYTSIVSSDENQGTEVPGIKNKLTNLNIPLQSFYYALSVVKSTYNPNTGKMLKEYYADKAVFMEKYKDKLK